MKKALSILMAVMMILAAGIASAEVSGKTFATPEEPADLNTESNKVVIYSGAEEYRNEYFLQRLNGPAFIVDLHNHDHGNVCIELFFQLFKVSASIAPRLDGLSRISEAFNCLTACGYRRMLPSKDEDATG